MERGAGFALAAAALSLAGTLATAQGEAGAGLGGDAVPRRMRAAGAAPVPSHARPAAPAARDEVCELARSDRARTPSQSCIACHDGTAGQGVEFSMGPPGTSMSHPVEVDQGAAAARDPARYVAPGTLPPDVPLVGGRVTCTSCHDGASPDPKRVTNPLGLCQSCHRL